MLQGRKRGKDMRIIEDLLALRAQQIQRRDEDLEKIILFLQRMRQENKKIFDNFKNIRENHLITGNLIFLYDI